MTNPGDADVIVVGAGLAGLVATAELADAGKRVLLLDQEGEQSLGGQAFWSLGGLFLVDTPEQRRLGIKDSYELARQDWFGSAQFDRESDYWPRKWAEAYVGFAAAEKRQWLHDQGLRIFPVVGWAERGDGRAGGHGNSVPRFHLTWGTRPGVVEPFERRVREAMAKGLVTFGFRHRVDDLVKTDGVVTGVRGAMLGRRRRARQGVQPRGDQSLRVHRAGRHRDLGWHRRRPRPGSQAVAGRPPRPAAEVHGRGRPGTRRRPDAAHHRGGRGGDHQPRPDVATPRAFATGTRSGRTTGSKSCLGRHRCGSPPPASASPRRTCRASTPWAPWARSCAPAMTTRGSC